ncbi:MAG TPA: hypothetical protein DGG95_02935 [Cytophagales bacterium]|nr:hypothetical protein [Cytophagales bacterium]
MIGATEDVEFPAFSEFNVDIFGRIRTSLPISVFDAGFWIGTRPQLFSTLVASGGTVTHNANLSSMILSTAATLNSRGVIQSLKPLKYRPGKSTRVLMSGSLRSAATGVKKYFGQFNENNGPYFLLDGSTLKVGIRSKVSGTVVDTQVAQNSWNIDKLDGTGESGITLDITKQQVFLIEYQWLGSGTIKYGFFINEKTYYVHQIHNSNILTVPYSQTATLPIRAEIIASGSATASDMHFTCVSVQSEDGNSVVLGHRETISTGVALKTFNSTTASPILALRKQSGSLGVPVGIDSYSTFCSTTDDVLFEVHINPSTLSGVSWVNSGQHLQFDVSATAMTFTAPPIYSFIVRGAATTPSVLKFQNLNEYPEIILGSDLADNSEVFVIAARSFTGSANVAAVINIIVYV